jgi:hypothetical protein
MYKGFAFDLESPLLSSRFLSSSQRTLTSRWSEGLNPVKRGKRNKKRTPD